MKIDILGTKYKVIFASEKERPYLNEADGYMDHSTKEIIIGKFEKGPMSIEDLESYTKKVLRHEIIHAFLYESGLWNNSGNVEAWAQSEEITDWMAIQFPKILQTFKKAKAI